MDEPVPADALGIAAAARAHIHDVLAIAVAHTASHAAVIVSDMQCELTRIIARAYLDNLPSAVHVDFGSATPEEVMRSFDPLKAGDLVVLVQSTSFRLEAFRVRVELFKRGLKVIEHPHLSRMRADEYANYVNALAYDPDYYRVVGPALKRRIDVARGAVVDSGGAELVYDSTFEPAKLNIGDYSTMKNVGGQFPIGEVFTEPSELSRVNGRVRIFVFGDTQYRVNVPERPITLVIAEGRVAGVVDSTPDFDRVIAQISADEVVWIRELGFGMNRAFSRDRRVSDVGTYERMCGIHLSLGAKHGVYNKPDMKRRDGKYHVDVFAVTERVLLDGEVVYSDGAWRI